MVHEHWDGCARPRNVDYGTRRLGDHEPYPSHGSGSPGGVYRGRRGRLQVALRSYRSVLGYDPEGVNVSNTKDFNNSPLTLNSLNNNKPSGALRRPSETHIMTLIG